MSAAKNDDGPGLLEYPVATNGVSLRPKELAFDFSLDADVGPELELTNSGQTGSHQVSPMVANALDLSGKKKVICWVGRGKTGKTTGIRWLAEKAISNGTPLLMADLDVTNDTFSRYIKGVARPPEASDPALSLKWLDKLLQHTLQHQSSLIVDLGGGDTTLRRLIAQIPDLTELFEAQGFAVVLFHTAGPQEEDLSPLATLQALGFKPTATAIILNESLVDAGDTRENAFARIYRHSVFRRAIEEGAMPVFMPRLFAAQQVGVRRLKFRDAADGQTGRGDTPLGPFDRSRVRKWLEMMDTNFTSLKSWLP
jgi:hypothetical protein